MFGALTIYDAILALIVLAIVIGVVAARRKARARALAKRYGPEGEEKIENRSIRESTERELGVEETTLRRD
jgi:hypothetical protein